MQNHLAKLKEQLYGPNADPEKSKWMYKIPGEISKEVEVVCIHLRYTYRGGPDDPEMPKAFAAMDADDIRHFLTNVQGEGYAHWWMPDSVLAKILGVCGRVLSLGELKQLLEQFGCLSAYTENGFSKPRETAKSLALARALEASGNPWAHRFVDGGRPHPLTAAVQAHVRSGSGLSPAVVDRIVSGAMCVDEYRMLAEEGFGEMRGKRDYHSTEMLVAVFERYGRVLSRGEVMAVLERSTHYDKGTGLITTGAVQRALIESGNPYAFRFCKSLQEDLHSVMRHLKGDLNCLSFVSRDLLADPAFARVIAGDLPRVIWALQGAGLMECRAVVSMTRYSCVEPGALVQLLCYWTGGPGRIRIPSQWHSGESPTFIDAPAYIMFDGQKGMTAARRFVGFTHASVPPHMIGSLLDYFQRKDETIMPAFVHRILGAVLRPTVLQRHYTPRNVPPHGNCRVAIPLGLLHRSLSALLISNRFVLDYMSTMGCCPLKTSPPEPPFDAIVRKPVSLIRTLVYAVNGLQFQYDPEAAYTDPLEGPFRCFLSTSRPEPGEFLTGLVYMDMQDEGQRVVPDEQRFYFLPWGLMLCECTRRMLRPCAARPNYDWWVFLVADNRYLHPVVGKHGREVWLTGAEREAFAAGVYILVAAMSEGEEINWRRCEMSAEMCDSPADLDAKLRRHKDDYEPQRCCVYRLDVQTVCLPHTVVVRTKEALEMPVVPRGVREVAGRVLDWAMHSTERCAHDRWQGPFCAVIQSWLNRLRVVDRSAAEALFPGQPPPRYNEARCLEDMQRMVKRNRALMRAERGSAAGMPRGRWLMTLMTEHALERGTVVVLDWWRMVLAHVYAPVGERWYLPGVVNRGGAGPLDKRKRREGA